MAHANSEWIVQVSTYKSLIITNTHTYFKCTNSEIFKDISQQIEIILEDQL